MNYDSNIGVFCRESQIKDLSDGPNTGSGDSKKPRSSGSYTDEANIFEEGVEPADCREVLFNYLMNFEGKINDLFKLVNSNE